MRTRIDEVFDFMIELDYVCGPATKPAGEWAHKADGASNATILTLTWREGNRTYGEKMVIPNGDAFDFNEAKEELDAIVKRAREVLK